MNKVTPGIYVHYKSEHLRYEVLGTGRNTETGEDYVVYRPLYDAEDQPDFWVRPYEVFTGQVEVDGILQDRFTRVDSR